MVVHIGVQLKSIETLILVIIGAFVAQNAPKAVVMIKIVQKENAAINFMISARMHVQQIRVGTMARAKPITTVERLNVSVKKITSDLGVNFKNVLIQILKKIVRKPKTMLGAGGH